MDAAAGWMAQQADLKALADVGPAGVEVSRRAGENREVYIVVNSTNQPKSVELRNPCRLLLAQTESSRIELPAYGVELFVPAQH